MVDERDPLTIYYELLEQDAPQREAVNKLFEDSLTRTTLGDSKNYYIYNELLNGSRQFIYVPTDISINNINDHTNAIFSILKDGIETDMIHNLKIPVKWENAQCRLSISDYWITLFMWSMILQTNHPIRPKHIFLGSKANRLTGTDGRYFPWELTQNDIQKYVDKYILTLENKINIGNIRLNEIIANGIWQYCLFEHFAYYLANTVNNEDDIYLARACPEFQEALHCSLAGIPFAEVKAKGMEITNAAIEIIKDSERYIGFEHGLTNSFRAREAVNPRQFKEASFNIGTKPNGSGGIYPFLIDKNFKTGGVNDPLSYFIESSTARTAQILSKINVGESGDFARLLGLNNTDTILNLDPNYECMSRHFIRFIIKSKKHLSMVRNRYFRFNPKGIDYRIDENDESLIGQTIYLHSPMTCASNSAGHGICRKCYGDLYWVNNNINVGKIAAEILSSQLTQTLLSAKHLLETRIITTKWYPKFKSFFDIDINAIRLSDDMLNNDNLKKYFMIIDPETIELVNEEEDALSSSDENESEMMFSDDSDSENDEGEAFLQNEDFGVYNEYITSFIIRTPEGADIVMGSEDQHELYISNELNSIIRKRAVAVDNSKIAIPLSALGDSNLFFIRINNNEISKTMDDIIHIIDKASVTENLTKDEALQNIVDLIIEGNLKVDAIHLEVILSNQIVSPDNILKKPNWNEPNAQYRLFTLNKALTNNPSVIISLLYKDLNRVLYNPLTFKKNAPSFFDLFFCEQPQNYMNDELYTEDTSTVRDYETRVQMYRLTGKPTREKELMAELEKRMKPEDYVISFKRRRH